MVFASLLLSASGYLIIAQPQSGSTAVAFSLGLAMLPRMCTYQDRDRHGHRVGRDKRNATALDPDFDWTAGSQETDLGNFELRELRNWLASDCVQKQHVVPTPTNVARVRTLGPTFAQRGVLLLRDPRASALSLCAKYHMANATDRLRRRLAYLQRFGSGWRTAAAAMGREGHAPMVLEYEDVLRGCSVAWVDSPGRGQHAGQHEAPCLSAAMALGRVAARWNLSAEQLKAQAARQPRTGAKGTHDAAPFAALHANHHRTHFVHNASRCQSEF